MFESEHTGGQVSEADSDEIELAVTAAVLQSDLPDIVRQAPLTYSDFRVINASEVDRLTSEELNPAGCNDTSARLQDRRRFLEQHIGQELICAVVRLPGATYTIEVDPSVPNIVHWEYQRY